MSKRQTAIGIKIPIASYAQKIKLSIGVGTTNGLSVRGGERFQKNKSADSLRFCWLSLFRFRKRYSATLKFSSLLRTRRGVGDGGA
jgi:hypothetical protein